MDKLLETLYLSDLSDAAYLAAEAAVLDDAAGREWRDIADRSGYYTQGERVYLNDLEENIA